MTLRQAYQIGKKQLEKAGVETPAFDAGCLFQKVFGMDRQQLILHAAEAAEEALAATYLAICAERAQGRPLQYILGEWPFMQFTLRVGEGVLVPREETELLVHAAAERIRKGANVQPPPKVIDLCGGSGAVALGLSSLLPNAEIFCAELYEEAYGYLQENIRRLGAAVTPVRLDVLSPKAAARFSGLDAVVSNPPYVEAGEIPGLQKEVRWEPHTALDGGSDGLTFYRAIARWWVPRLRPGGLAAVEIGEGQARAVAALFRGAGLEAVEVLKDFNGLDRVVAGRLRRSAETAGPFGACLDPV